MYDKYILIIEIKMFKTFERQCTDVIFAFTVNYLSKHGYISEFPSLDASKIHFCYITQTVIL